MGYCTNNMESSAKRKREFSRASEGSFNCLRNTMAQNSAIEGTSVSIERGKKKVPLIVTH